MIPVTHFPRYCHGYSRRHLNPLRRTGTVAQAQSLAAWPVAGGAACRRWRLGLVQGESRYEALEQKLATAPSISVPTITLEGDANGAPHPAPADYAKRFTGKYQFRLISGGIGHNLPQEDPQAFAKAVIDADHL